MLRREYRHSEYLTLLAFLRQQWLRERTSIWRLYIQCLCCFYWDRTSASSLWSPCATQVAYCFLLCKCPVEVETVQSRSYFRATRRVSARFGISKVSVVLPLLLDSSGRPCSWVSVAPANGVCSLRRQILLCGKSFVWSQRVVSKWLEDCAEKRHTNEHHCTVTAYWGRYFGKPKFGEDAF
jgi:hypothetical protein